MINILVADDHTLLRQGIKNVLELESDIKVIGEAADGEEAVALTEKLEPDILLLDMNMPKINGLEVTRKVIRDARKTKVVILSINDDENYVVEVIKAGASGYLLKDIDPGLLVKALRTVQEGNNFIYPPLASRIFGDTSGSKDQYDFMIAKLQERRRDEKLTHREIDVLSLICKGMSNQEIANTLYLSEKTVKNHLTNIFRKINVNDRTQAVLYALKHKIIMLD